MIIGYEEGSGRIQFTVNDPVRPEVAQYYREQTDIAVIFDDTGKSAETLADTHYVMRNKLRERPRFPISFTETRVPLGGLLDIEDLPQGCDVWIDDQHFSLDDGRLTLTTHSLDDFEVRLDHWPFQPASFAVKVIA